MQLVVCCGQTLAADKVDATAARNTLPRLEVQLPGYDVDHAVRAEPF